MRKSIFDPAVKAEVLQRLEKLNHDTVPQWGVMKPNQMLRHLIEANKIATGEITSANRSNFFTRTLIRKFVLDAKVPSLNMIKKRPIVTFPEINIVERGIHSAEFNTEKQNLIKDIDRVLAAKEFVPRSPLIGKMSRENWGQLGYSHIHYHFTQFGV